jgi:hypothetical protein
LALLSEIYEVAVRIEETIREMEQYLMDEKGGVPYGSGRVQQRIQKPQVVSQNPSRVLVRYGETTSTRDQE